MELSLHLNFETMNVEYLISIQSLGGENTGGQISSTEYLDREAGYWMEGVPMSSNVEAACSVAISESSLVIVGGTSGSFLSKVELFDIGTYEWTRLPDLRRGRYDHGCLLAEVNGMIKVKFSHFLKQKVYLSIEPFRENCPFCHLKDGFPTIQQNCLGCSLMMDQKDQKDQKS